MTTSLVVGANRGIGLALTQALCARGEEVIAVCRNTSEALDATNAIVERGIDVTDDASVGALAERLSRRTLDCVIVNAGILERTALEGLDLGSVRRQLEVNAIAPLRLAKALHPLIPKGGKLALITSRMGSIGDNTSGGSYGYRMSKAALNAAGRSLAHDLAARGTAVVLLHPGWVRTEMTGGTGQVSADESAAMLIARIDALTLASTGRFLHANGEELPW
jgi:NAD(P)-dependent dehydrogenase (short-subunit alcohol dehydrogenase family)